MAGKIDWFYALPKGHRLGKDKYQWIIEHPSGCKNAAGRSTYIRMDLNLSWELERCGIELDISNLNRFWSDSKATRRRERAPIVPRSVQASRLILGASMAVCLISGCRLGNDGDDADSPGIGLDHQASENQVNGSTAVIPEAATGILMAMGMGALWATNRGWRF